MARKRRKGVQQPVPMYVGIGAFTILVIYTVNNPWAMISIFLILLLIGSLAYGLWHMWSRIDLQIERTSRHRNASTIRTAPQMAFLSPTELEHYVAMLYENLGYTATVTKQSGDNGIDIILKNHQGTAAVQVKRYNKGVVGRPELQRLVGASLHFDKKIFVTTSTYSREAREYAVLHNVELIDGTGLADLAQKVFGPAYIDKALSQSILNKY